MERFPAEKNQFGKTSGLSLRAAQKDGRTILKDVSFTAPYKIMYPFARPDGSIQVMLLAASAGIMEGDRQKFSFATERGASMELISQSYDKIHQMRSGCARRHTDISVGADSTFCFHPQPVIPFKGSAFENTMSICLQNESSRFLMAEIISCGRYASKERFAYRYYHNLIEIFRAGKLIYRDCSRFEPMSFDLEGMGMFEGYTHLASLFLSKSADSGRFLSVTRKILSNMNEAEGDITLLCDGDYGVRILGNRAQSLEELCKTIMNVYLNG